MSSKKVIIDGIKQPVGDEITILPDQLHSIIVLHPEARKALDPDRIPADAEFLRSLAIRQIQAGIGRQNAQDNVELAVGSRRLSGIRDWINVDPTRWGADGPRGYRVKIVKIVNDLDIIDMMVAENLYRSAPDVVNLAATAALYEEKGLSHQQIADKLRFKSPSRVGQLLSVLRHGDRVKDLLHSGVMKEAQARELLGCEAGLIDSVAERLEGGEATSAVFADVIAAKRAAGMKKVRPRGEMLRELDRIKDRPTVFNFLQWAAGDPTVSLDEVFPPPRKAVS